MNLTNFYFLLSTSAHCISGHGSTKCAIDLGST